MADLISFGPQDPPSPVALRPPHDLRCECRDCGAHARVLVAYGVRTGYCSVCGSARLDEVSAHSGIDRGMRFGRDS